MARLIASATMSLPVTPQTHQQQQVSPPKTPLKHYNRHRLDMVPIAPMAPMAPSRSFAAQKADGLAVSTKPQPDMSIIDGDTTLVEPGHPLVTPKSNSRTKTSTPRKGVMYRCWVCQSVSSTRARLQQHLSTRTHYVALQKICDEKDNRKKLARYIEWCNDNHLPIEEMVTTEFNKVSRVRRDGFANSNEYAKREAARLAQDPFRGMYTEVQARTQLMGNQVAPQAIAAAIAQMTPTRHMSVMSDQAAIYRHLSSMTAEEQTSVQSHVHPHQQATHGVAEYRPYGKLPVLQPKMKNVYSSSGNYSATMIKMCHGFEIFGSKEEREPPALKGLILPGMGIWDSATPSQRRYRNQRKDADATLRIQRAAEAVGTREVIFDRNMDFMRERDICDGVSVPNSPRLEALANSTALALDMTSRHHSSNSTISDPERASNKDGTFDLDSAFPEAPEASLVRPFSGPRNTAAARRGAGSAAAVRPQTLPQMGTFNATSYSPYVSSSDLQYNALPNLTAHVRATSSTSGQGFKSSEVSYDHGMPNYAYGYKYGQNSH